ncbi:flagellar hook basal-body protein [Lyticum sinuosum]|uniref:Flagellar basal-body rod protein FlgG n=1 Tax=Lyticum sinuosum TaxID=1332059 RepID=A0AAE4VM28_9RICK|nr:flagellar hook basal-body protein [Lyticum sinuosum]MDZ5761381.1 Flagellar basal-body rod protein FlgG [Lyticum sinuosum]
MDNAIYSMLSGSIGEQNRARKSSNNIANAQTDGFKTDDMIFRNYITKDVNDNVSFPYDEKTIINFKQGAPNHTKHPLDFMIDGSGFFSVQTPEGVMYTRQGHFYRNNENLIVTTHGYPLLSTDGNPIAIDENDMSIVVNEIGEVYGRYTEANSIIIQELRSQIAIVDFPNRHLLRKNRDLLFISEEQTIPAENYKIVQGAVEESNINSINEMTHMVDLQKKVENETALISKIYHLQNKAYDILSHQP